MNVINSNIEKIQNEISLLKNQIEKNETLVEEYKGQIKAIEEKVGEIESNINEKQSELYQLTKYLEKEKGIEEFNIKYSLPLSEEAKDAIRKLIIEKTEELPDGMRLRIDIKLLDELIFCKSSDDKGLIKTPIWTGSFLKKIELKNVSFDNVIFGILDDKENIIENDSIYDIDFSDTDIKVDFSKCRAAGLLSSCNFKGVDLSNSCSEIIRMAKNCNFSETNIKLNLNQNDKICFIKCNFSNNDMEGLEINSNNLSLSDNKLILFRNNWVNTKVVFKSTALFDKELQYGLETGFFHGCYYDFMDVKELIDNRKAEYINNPYAMTNPAVIQVDDQNNIINCYTGLDTKGFFKPKS